MQDALREVAAEAAASGIGGELSIAVQKIRLTSPAPAQEIHATLILSRRWKDIPLSHVVRACVNLAKAEAEGTCPYRLASMPRSSSPSLSVQSLSASLSRAAAQNSQPQWPENLVTVAPVLEQLRPEWYEDYGPNGLGDNLHGMRPWFHRFILVTRDQHTEFRELLEQDPAMWTPMKAYYIERGDWNAHAKRQRTRAASRADDYDEDEDWQISVHGRTPAENASQRERNPWQLCSAAGKYICCAVRPVMGGGSVKVSFMVGVQYKWRWRAPVARLHEATGASYMACARALAVCEPDHNSTHSYERNSALDQDAASNLLDEETGSLLSSRCAELIEAAISGSSYRVRQHLAAGVHPDEEGCIGGPGAYTRTHEPRVDSTTAVVEAAAHGHTAVLRLLLQHGATVDLADCNGFTPLYCACANGHADAVQLLIAGNADANLECQFSRTNCITPLYVACQRGHEACASVLLSSGACVDAPLRHSGTCGVTPLFAACVEGRMWCVTTLLSHRADPDREAYCLGTQDIWTPTAACLYHGRPGALDCLVSAQASMANQSTMQSVDVLKQSACTRVLRRMLHARTCAFCNESRDSQGNSIELNCSACRQVYYCCKEHQQLHWKAQHKHECTRAYVGQSAAARAAEARRAVARAEARVRNVPSEVSNPGDVRDDVTMHDP